MLVPSNGLQPRAGSTNRSSSPLSLPFAIVVAPPMAFLLAAEFWAVWPLPLSRYSVTVLSLWSWSISEKLRVMSHGCPSLPMPAGGTFSMPWAICLLASAKNAAALQADVWLMTELLNASMHRPCTAPWPSRTRVLPLNPMLMITCEPGWMAGAAGGAAGVVPSVMTSGSYTWTWPSGARIVASTNAWRLGLASEQPSASCHGVARPWALSGLAGTNRVQFIELAACAAVWFRLTGLPAASTASAPARSAPPRPKPLKSSAGAPAVGLAVADPLAHGDGVAAGAAAAALALADGEAQEPSADWLIVVALPPETARMIPRVRPNAIGMASGTAMRAARVLLPRRRHADRCPLSIRSTSMDVRCELPVDHRRPGPGRNPGIQKICVLSGSMGQAGRKPR